MTRSMRFWHSTLRIAVNRLLEMTQKVVFKQPFCHRLSLKANPNKLRKPSPIIIFLFLFESVNLYLMLLFFNKLLNCVLFKLELSFNLFVFYLYLNYHFIYFYKYPK